MNKLIKATAFAIISIYTANSIASNLFLFNNTSWPIDVKYVRDGRELEKRLDPTDTIPLSNINNVDSIRILPHGKGWSYFALGETVVPLENSRMLAQGNPKNDITITISTTWSGAWGFEEKSLEKKLVRDLPLSGRVVDAFPAVRTQSWWNAMSLGWLGQIQPRHILGVKDNASLDSIKAAYKALSLQLHPDKLSQLGMREYATAVFKALNQANEYLIKEKAIKDSNESQSEKDFQLTQLGSTWNPEQILAGDFPEEYSDAKQRSIEALSEEFAQL